MQKSLSLILLLMILCLAACSSLPHGDAVPVVFTQNSHALHQRITHHVIWQDQNNTETFIAVLETHVNAIKLVAVSSTGISLFSIDQTPNNQHIETSLLFPPLLNPQALLTYLQLMNNDSTEFSQALDKEWKLIKTDKSLGLHYKQQKTPIITLTSISPDTTVVKNEKKGVSVTIKKLSSENLQ